jgi:GH18 family chitinase
LRSQRSLKTTRSVSHIADRPQHSCTYLFRSLKELDSRDDVVLKDLVKQKNERWSSVKVSIAVGGWTFSTADPTRTIFSRMLATSSSRATFISSVKSFIGNYGLNGVDIDLEYPAAIERAAPAEGSLLNKSNAFQADVLRQDTPNLTSLFAEMRSSLGTGTIISLGTTTAPTIFPANTFPASYAGWILVPAWLSTR